MKTLGRTLRTAREGRKLSQKTVGERLGFESPQFVSNMERGKASLPADLVPIVSKILAIPEKVLIDHMVEIYRQNVLAKVRAVKGRGSSR